MKSEICCYSNTKTTSRTIQFAVLALSLSLIWMTGCAGGSGTQTITNPQPGNPNPPSGGSGPTALTIVSSYVPDAETGISYSAELSASGGTQPYMWEISSGSLPKGLSLTASDGAITGSTTAAGSFSFTATVTDAAAKTAQQNFSLTVAPANSSTFDGPAELPRVFLQTAIANTPAPGIVTTVPTGGDLQAALNAAHCGDTIELAAGATFSGTFTLPAKSCDNHHWIIVRTSTPDTSLPAEGHRMTPCYANVNSLPGRPSFNCNNPQKFLSQISYPSGGNQSGPVILANGANYYRLIGLEITRPAGSGAVVALVSPVQNGSADHIIVDRCWLHGTVQDDTRRGVALSGTTNVALIDSYLDDFHCTSTTGACTDAQVTGGGLGNLPSGPWKITDNFLEASGENLEFGGGAATVTPADIEIRYNHFFKPLQWMTGAPGFVGGASGRPFEVKNHLEFKNAQRVLVEGNIFENNWGGFSQNGYSILLTPRNSADGSGNINCPTCKVTDITVRYNTVSHVGAGLTVAAVLVAGAGAQAAGHFSIHDITVDDIDAIKYNGGGGLLLITNGWNANVLNSISLSHITAFPGFTHPTGHLLTVSDSETNPAIANFSFTDNIVYVPQFPVWSAGFPQDCSASDVPITILTTCFDQETFAGNVLIATPSTFPVSKWPTGNYFVATVDEVGFTNFNNGVGGDYHLSPSSPYKNNSGGPNPGANIDAINAAIANSY